MRWIGMLLVLGLAAPLGAQGPAKGDIAPTVSVPDLDGTAVPLVVPTGKRAAVIEFWATWCERCKALMPAITRARSTYGKRVEFYGVNVTVNDPKSHVLKYLKENAPPFRALYDARGVAVKAFQALTTSYVVIVDSTGHIRYTGTGGDQDIPAELAKVVGR